MKINELREDLVTRLVEYEENRDLYNFRDCYDNKDEAYQDVEKILCTRKGINNILYELNEDIEDDNLILETEMQNEELLKFQDIVKKLYDDVYEYKKMFLKEIKERESEVEY